MTRGGWRVWPGSLPRGRCRSRRRGATRTCSTRYADAARPRRHSPRWWSDTGRPSAASAGRGCGTPPTPTTRPRSSSTSWPATPARCGTVPRSPGWLVRVAHLTCLKCRRRHARRPAAALPAELPAARVPDAAAEREQAAIVAEELSALPERLRAVLVLCAVEGHSNSEAAAALNCPKGTVDSRLAAAKARLRSRLVRRGVGLAAAALNRPCRGSGPSRPRGRGPTPRRTPPSCTPAELPP